MLCFVVWCTPRIAELTWRSPCGVLRGWGVVGSAQIAMIYAVTLMAEHACIIVCECWPRRYSGVTCVLYYCICVPTSCVCPLCVSLCAHAHVKLQNELLVPPCVSYARSAGPRIITESLRASAVPVCLYKAFYSKRFVIN